MNYLQDRLDDCWTVRAPAACVARILIRGLPYSLLLFDDVLMDSTGAELTRFVRSLEHRRHTPITLFRRRDNLELLARTITRLVAA